MKKITLNFFNAGTYPNNVNMVLLILRVVIGLFMLNHGIGKLLMLFGTETIEFPDPLGVGIKVSLALTVFSEVFCSTLLIIGFCSRFAAVFLFITMIIIVGTVHLHDGFDEQELALHYALTYAAIALLGAGKYSLDNLLFKNIHHPLNFGTH